MNGFTLWVLLAASGQVGDTVERDKGWQINPDDGLLEYIVQISPEKANFMSSAAKEFESDVPRDVAARLSRVVVRIGSDPLISTPMEEVLRLPVVTTAVLANIEETAGRGKFSQLESGPPSEVRNVGGTGSGLPLAPTTSLADQSRSLPSENLLAQSTPSSSFANEARGVSSGTGKFSNTGSPSTSTGSSLGSTTNPGTFPATGPQLPTAPTGMVGPPPASNFPTTPTNSHSSVGSFPTSGNLGNGVGSSQNAPNNGSYPSSGTNGNYAGSPTSQAHNNQGYNNPGFSNQGSYGQSTSSPFGQTPGYNGPSSGSGNFGGLPAGSGAHPFPPNQYATAGTGLGAGGYGQSPYGQSPYGQSPYAQSPYAQTPGSQYTMPTDPPALPNYSQFGYNQQPTRVADNRGSAFPTTAPSSGLNTSSPSTQERSAATPSRSTNGANDVDFNSHTSVQRGGMDNVVPVMFVLSLVVNFYLGMLIRKLLTRYRSLLSSVRGQAV